MTDFNSNRISKKSSNQKPSPFRILPVLYGAELFNTALKTHYHHQTKHFYQNFCERNYFAFDYSHKLAFHPIRILLDSFTQYVYCAGVSRAGYWRQFLAGFTSAAFTSFSLQFIEELKYARSFSVSTPRSLNLYKDFQIGVLYGLSKASLNSFKFIKQKTGYDLNKYHFIGLYLALVTGFDFLSNNFMFRKHFALKGNLPICFLRVGVSWLAHNYDFAQRY